LSKYTIRELFWYGYRRLFIYILPLWFWRIVFKIKCIFWGIKCGSGVKVWGGVDLATSSKDSIKIGDDVSLISSSRRCAASALFSNVKLRTFKRSARIVVGSNVSLSATSIAARSKTVEIGDGTCVAPNVIIMDTDFHSLWPPEGRAQNPGYEQDADVIVGKNVWLGINSIILKGVKIGDNTVIGAGSVVTSDIPANCVAAGNPAKVLKELP